MTTSARSIRFATYIVVAVGAACISIPATLAATPDASLPWVFHHHPDTSVTAYDRPNHQLTDQHHLRSGDVVTLQAHGFHSGELVDVTADGHPLGSVVADSGGAAAFRFRTPRQLGRGRHNVAFTGRGTITTPPPAPGAAGIAGKAGAPASVEGTLLALAPRTAIFLFTAAA
ncbi:MAG: hypothetical protein JWN95_2307 [Frankiales bacterium]|nr:hypothetical protein [Frankiales bacterium]